MRAVVLFVLTLSASCVEGLVHHLRPSPRVILGTTADLSKVSFFCSLHVDFPDDAGTSICGCVLVSSTVGATAGHCFVRGDETFSQAFVSARLKLYGTGTTGTVRLSSSSVAIHPEYDVRDLANDVAVFRIGTPVGALFPTLNRERAAWDRLTTWDRLTVVGVGVTNVDTGALSLGSPRATHLSRRDCEHPENSFGEAFVGWAPWAHLGDICAGPYAACETDGRCADSCSGDSGGPLFAETADGNVTVYGLVSRGSQKCGRVGGKPGIYAPTDEHWEFMTTASRDINSSFGSNSESGAAGSPRFLPWVVAWAAVLSQYIKTMGNGGTTKTCRG